MVQSIAAVAELLEGSDRGTRIRLAVDFGTGPGRPTDVQKRHVGRSGEGLEGR